MLLGRAEEKLLFRGLLHTFTFRLLLAASRWIRLELAQWTVVRSVDLINFAFAGDCDSRSGWPHSNYATPKLIALSSTSPFS